MTAREAVSGRQSGVQLGRASTNLGRRRRLQCGCRIPEVSRTSRRIESVLERGRRTRGQARSMRTRKRGMRLTMWKVLRATGRGLVRMRHIFGNSKHRVPE